MGKLQCISELQARKDEVQLDLQTLERQLGYFAIKEELKNITKDVLDSYADFEEEIEDIRKDQQSIQKLDVDRVGVENSIKIAKETKAELQNQSNLLYLSIGQSLFENYSPSYAEAFGATYTNIGVIDLKIAESKSKEENYKEENVATSFFGKILSGAKIGLKKNQIVLQSQKKESLIIQGALNAIEKGFLDALDKNNELDTETKTLFAEFLDISNDLKEQDRLLETYVQEEKAIKASLDQLGVGISVQGRIKTLDSDISKIESERDIFCTTAGHDYACRYVSPDAEIVVDFPKKTERLLSNIQQYKKAIVSLSRKIEIADIEQGIANEEKEIEENKEKIENLQNEVNNLQSTVKLKTEEIHVLKKKLEELKKQEEV